MGSPLYRGPTGDPGGEVHLLGTSRDSKDVSGNGCVSLCGDSMRGNLKGGFLYWRP